MVWPAYRHHHDGWNDNLSRYYKSDLGNKPSRHDIWYNLIHSVDEYDECRGSCLDDCDENIHLHKQHAPDDEHEYLQLYFHFVVNLL